MPGFDDSARACPPSSAVFAAPPSPRRRSLAFALASAWLWLGACGGGSATDRPSIRPQPATDASDADVERDGPAQPSDADIGAAPVDVATPLAVSRAECEVWLDHVLGVARAAHASQVPAELSPTDEQLADIRTEFAVDMIPACMTLDRPTYDCQMAADSREQLVHCMPGEPGDAPAP